ncbi:MAG: hypothetical protein O7H39_17200 [Gammaproteobacteria bacterium]|nr:hypothetical protein [Gammaproteobacteria bacterium]
MASTGQFDISCSGQLTVQLHRPGLTGLFRRAIPADCLQISTKGMRIETVSQLKTGQHVIADVQVYDLRVEELHGVVSSTTAVGERYYYDIDFGRTQQNRDTLHCLRQLETHLRDAHAEDATATETLT